MKYKLIFLSILSLFLLSSCNKDKIFLKITSPAKGEEFKMYEDIDVNITAYTKKGSILQVVLTVDTVKTVYLSEKPPYYYLIEKGSFRDTGVFFISVLAYSSEGVREGAAIDIKIVK